MSPAPLTRLHAGVRALFGRQRFLTPRADAVVKVQDGLRRGTEESIAEAVAIGRATETLATLDLVRLAGRFVVTGHGDVARALVDEADRRAIGELNPRQR